MLQRLFICVYLFSNIMILPSNYINPYDINKVVGLAKYQYESKLDNRLQDFFKNITLVEISKDYESKTCQISIMSGEYDTSTQYIMTLYGISLSDLEKCKRLDDV